MALVNTSAYNLDLRSSSQLSNSESKYDESSVKTKELLKMGEENRKISGRSISLPSIDILLDEKPGWPFLKKATFGRPQVHQWHTRKVSVVNWVMSLPERFPNHQHNLNYETSFIKKQVKDILRDNKK